MATILAKSLCSSRKGESIRDSVEWIGAALEEASDASMPRSRSSPKRSAYWWSEEIAELWRSSTSARRLLSRARQRGDQAGVDASYEVYRAARHLMHQAIKKAKAKSWQELINSFDTDP
jgi:hypothetical protein